MPTGDENPYAAGTYVTGNKLRGIRNYAANFPYTGAFPAPRIYPQVDPLNFSDVGYDVTGPEVHADGEIWVAINFELRKALARSTTSSSRRQTRRCRSSARSASCRSTSARATAAGSSSLFDAFLLMPSAPSMVDARNAILAADQARFGGADQAELGRRSRAAAWAASRRRPTAAAARPAWSPTPTRCRTSRRRIRPTPT